MILRKRKKTNNQKKKYKEFLKKMGVKDTGFEFTPLKSKSVFPIRDGSNDYKDIKSLDIEVYGAMEKSGIMGQYHKLSEKDKNIVDKLSKCIAPLHKSNYTYVTPGMNPSSLGRKNEVL